MRGCRLVNHRDLDRPGAGEAQGERERVAGNEGLRDAEKHEVWPTGAQRDRALRLQRDLLEQRIVAAAQFDFLRAGSKRRPAGPPRCRDC